MKKIMVSDMMCNHCVKTIKEKFDSEDVECEVDLSTKTVTVEDDDYEEAIKLIKKAGFNPQE